MTARTPLAGVIEGFYGRPWSHDERLEMIDFLAEVGLNTFIYSPKNDLFTRQRWRDPYPEREAAELAELVTRAHAVGVDVHFALSPGLSMRYSDPADTDAILAKFAQVADVGIDGFELFLDDIPDALELVDRAEDYRTEYNTVRPHEAIAWNRPLEVHLGLADPTIPNFEREDFLPTT
mgnify:CR=1 FL=1